MDIVWLLEFNLKILSKVVKWNEQARRSRMYYFQAKFPMPHPTELSSINILEHVNKHFRIFIFFYLKMFYYKINCNKISSKKEPCKPFRKTCFTLFFFEGGGHWFWFCHPYKDPPSDNAWFAWALPMGLKLNPKTFFIIKISKNIL